MGSALPARCLRSFAVPGVGPSEVLSLTTSWLEPDSKGDECTAGPPGQEHGCWCRPTPTGYFPHWDTAGEQVTLLSRSLPSTWLQTANLGCEFILSSEHGWLEVASRKPPASNCSQGAHLLSKAYLRYLLYVSQEYLLVSGNRCRSVVVYQLVQRVELDHPEEVLASSVPEHLEVLHIIPKPGGQRAHAPVTGLCLARRAVRPECPEATQWLMAMSDTSNLPWLCPDCANHNSPTGDEQWTQPNCPPAR